MFGTRRTRVVMFHHRLQEPGCSDGCQPSVLSRGKSYVSSLSQIVPPQAIPAQDCRECSVLTFTWLLVHPTVLAAQMRVHGRPPAETRPPSEEAELAGMLTKMEEKLAKTDLKRLVHQHHPSH
jgi:hypothetical protein